MQLPADKKAHQDNRNRPPRLYKTAASILKEFQEGKDSVKNLVFSTKQTQFGGKPRPKHPNTKALFALVSNAVNHKAQVDAATKKIDLFTIEPKLNKELAAILITELVWGKGELPGESPPVTTVLKYKKRIKKCVDKDAGLDGRALSETWPRYARVNTLLSSEEEVDALLKEEGWIKEQYSPCLPYPSFLSLVCSLAPSHYLQDLHLPNLLVFPPQTPLYEHSLVTTGKLLLQDKASCLPVACLSPPAGSVVLDSCAAPGMKTSQVAAMVCREGAAGRVVAVERSSKRAETLKQILAKSGADAVTTVLNCDFLDVVPSEHPEVQYLVVDPSCSGTGMALRGGGDTEPPGQDRLDRLAGLQARLLRHALSFPGALGVVYSTCATSATENEAVVASVVGGCQGWRVREGVLPDWGRRGNPYQGAECQEYLRALPDEDLCNGFFVAVLEKVEVEGEDMGEKKAKKKKKNKEALEQMEEALEVDEKTEDIEVGIKTKKDKKKKREALEEVDKVKKTDIAHEMEVEVESPKKKKSKKDKKDRVEKDELVDDTNVETYGGVVKKKKRDKLEKAEDNDVIIDHNVVAIADEEVNTKKKKKKKSKETEAVTEAVIGDEAPEKKKKSKRKLEDLEDSVTEGCEPVEKSKKKKKKKSE